MGTLDGIKAALFFAALGKDKKLMALAKADRMFVGHRPLTGQEGDINTKSGQGKFDSHPSFALAAISTIYTGIP